MAHLRGSRGEAAPFGGRLRNSRLPPRSRLLGAAPLVLWPGVHMPSAESRRGRNLPAPFFRSRHCLVLLTATTAPLSTTTLLRTAPLSAATLELAPLFTATLDLRTAPRSATTLELHTTTLAAAALNPDIATTSIALNFATATTSTVKFASTALSITPAVPAFTAAPA
jgi:hypothetical protein